MKPKKLTASTVSLVPRETLEKQALLMRRRARNADLERNKVRRRLFTAFVGAGSAYATGFIVGRRLAQGLPTQYSGVDLELVVGGTAALGGILMQGSFARAKGSAFAGEFLEAGGMGVLAYYAGSRGESHGQRSAQAAA
jgi:hypothetical protein